MHIPLPWAIALATGAVAVLILGAALVVAKALRSDLGRH